MSGFQITTLDSGLRVVTDYLRDSKFVSMSWILLSGANRDIQGKAGTAHFFEHLLGQSNVANPDFDFNVKYDNYGHASNFITGPAQTFIFTHTLPQNFASFLSDYGDMVTGASLRLEDIEEQREIIRKEFFRGQNNPDKVFIFNSLNAIYPNQDFGRTTLGSLDEIEKMSRDDLVEYAQRNYLAGDMAVIVSGPVPHEHTVKLVEQAFSATPKGSNGIQNPAIFHTGKPKNFEVSSESQKLAIYFQIPPKLGEGYYAYHLLAKMLNDPLDSFLRKNGITYSASISCNHLGGNAFMNIALETEAGKSAEAISKIQYFLENADKYLTAERYEGITNKNELDNAFNFSSPYARLEAIRDHFSQTGSLISYEDIKEAENKPDLASIKNALFELRKQPSKVIGMGPDNDLPALIFNEGTSFSQQLKVT